MMWVFTVGLVAASCSATQGPISNVEPRASVAVSGSGETTLSTALAAEESEGSVAPEAQASQVVTTTTSTSQLANPDTASSCQRLPESDDQPWVVVNDGVMGGRSQGLITTADNRLQFAGNIVTDGGGFSSVRRALDSGLEGSDRIQLRVRTDGREYEVLLTDIESQAYRVTYYAPIEVEANDWQVVDVSFDDLEARIFGREVDAPPFQPENVTTVGIILADGTDGEFSLELDWISACSGALS